MKKVLLFLLTLVPLLSFGQNSGQGYVVLNDFSSPFQRSAFWLRTAIPAGSVPVFTMSGTNSVRIHTDTTFINTLANRNDTVVYKLVSIGSDAMLRAFVPKYLLPNDTNSLSNRINFKLNASDTNNHWLSIGYVPNWNSITNKPNFLDSTTIYTIINGKLNIGDTIGKWLPIGTFIPDTMSLSNRIDHKLNIQDTAGHWLPIGTHIPTDQVNADWNSISGVSQILNKPIIPSSQVNSDWNSNSGISQILNKPSLSTVATSGSYNDLISKPTIPPAQVQTDWNATIGLGVLLNKPTIPSIPSNISYFTNDVGYLTTVTSSQINSALGGSPVLNTRTLTINGTTFDLSLNRTWNVGDVLTTGTYPNPIWIPSYAWSKITGTPTTLSGYNITDGVTNSSLSTTLSSYATSSSLTSGLAGKENTISAGTTSQYWRGDKTWQTLNTSVVPEISNLYHTDARSRASISLTTIGSGGASYNSTSGVINVPTPSQKRVESYSGTTNGSGIYTVTYATAFSSVPNVQFQLNGGSNKMTVLLTSSTTTGFTLYVQLRADVLGLLPSYSNVSGQAVDIMVFEK